MSSQDGSINHPYHRSKSVALASEQRKIASLQGSHELGPECHIPGGDVDKDRISDRVPPPMPERDDDQDRIFDRDSTPHSSLLSKRPRSWSKSCRFSG